MASKAWGGISIAATGFSALLEAVRAVRRRGRADSPEARRLLSESSARRSTSASSWQRLLVQLALLLTLALLAAVSCVRFGLQQSDLVDVAVLVTVSATFALSAATTATRKGSFGSHGPSLVVSTATSLIALVATRAAPLLLQGKNAEWSASSICGLVQCLDTWIVLTLLLLVPNPAQATDAASKASPLSRLLFAYLDRGMITWYLYEDGPKGRPFRETIPDMPADLHTSEVLRSYKYKEGRQTSSSLWDFAKAFKWELAAVLAFAVVWIVSLFGSPLCMNLLLRYIQSNERNGASPYLYVVGIFLAPVVSSITFQNALFIISKVGLRIRSILGHSVFEKLLRTREGGGDDSEGAGAEAVGRVNNLVGTDIDVITSSLESGLQLLAVPPKLIVSLLFLYSLLGWPAFVALGTIVAFAPLSYYVSKSYGGVQEEIMKVTDKRITLVGEMLSAVRTLKMFAWERSATDRITELRHAELDKIKKRAYVFSLMMLLSTGIPTAVTLATFAAYIFGRGESLTASTAFTSMSLFGLLREAVISSTYLLSAFMRARVSLGRIAQFIDKTEELDNKSLTPAQSVGFEKAELTWSRASGKRAFKLSINDLIFPNGKLSIVAGDVGSGKSALLYALLGEMHSRSGKVLFPRASVSYAAQSPWLQDDTIRNNILFGAKYDDQRYKKTIYQCALSTDLDELQEGDRTRVGENGFSLSGGQKQRISLARAVYARSKVVLLDDVLSAVDSGAVSHLIEHCLDGDLLKGRTVILVTHFVSQCSERLQSAELVVHLANGRVKSTSKPKRDKADKGEQPRKVEQTTQRAKESDKQDVSGQRQSSEDDDTGVSVTWAVYRRYFSAMGGAVFWIIYSIINLIAHVFMLGQGYFVGYWVNRPDRDERALLYFGIYAGIQLVGAVALTAMYLDLIYGAIKASRTLHKSLLSSIFGAPFRFFDTHPQGNILNRFSKDMETIDTEIVENTQPVFDYSVQVLFVAIVVSITLPVFLIPALLIGLTFFMLGRLYLKSALTARKHVASARSPLFSCLGDTTSGAVTIRAWYRQRDFADRYRKQTDTYNQRQLYEFALDRWLEQRSDFVGASVSFIVGMLSLQTGLSSGLAGFLISTGLEFTSRILFVVRAINKNELSLNSAHRVIQYSQVEQEPSASRDAQPPAHWPSQGKVDFEHLSVRYSEDGDDVLKDLTLTVEPGEKVGIVGKSGCGKSSLALSLLRFIIQSDGRIIIDGVDTSQINLPDLRSRVTLIPQDPTLFNGSVRSNLDPYGEHDDADLWHALERSRFTAVNQADGDTGSPGQKRNSDFSLDSHVSNGGANLSQGQRQLLSLARAIARQSKIIILDEATASLDNETDRLVQEVIRKEFGSATNLTIAHRLESIMDFDRVLVLQQGRIAEFDKPAALLQRTDGVFAEMVRATGNEDELRKMVQ